MRDLSLVGIRSSIETGDWYSILKTIKTMQLERLHLEYLTVRRVQMSMLGGGSRLCKAYRGPKGIEQYSLTNDTTSMAGASAVQTGTDIIVERFRFSMFMGRT